MKWFTGLIGSLLLFVSSAAFSLPSAPGVLATKDMADAPVTAVAVTQCNLLVAAYFTLKDGRFVKSDVKDHPSDVSADDVLRWGDTATTGAHRVEVNCDDPGRMFKRTANTPESPKIEDQHFISLNICGEAAAFEIASSQGLKIIVLEDEDAATQKRIRKDLDIIRKHDQLEVVELKGACAST